MSTDTDYRVFTIYPVGKNPKQKWWTEIKHRNGSHLFRSTEGLNRRKRAFEQAVKLGHLGDRVHIKNAAGEITHRYLLGPYGPRPLLAS